MLRAKAEPKNIKEAIFFSSLGLIRVVWKERVLLRLPVSGLAQAHEFGRIVKSTMMVLNVESLFWR